MTKTILCETFTQSPGSEAGQVSPNRKVALLHLNTEGSSLLPDVSFRIIALNHSFQKLWLHFAQIICEINLILIKVSAHRLEILKNILLQALLDSKAEGEMGLCFPNQSTHTYFIRYKPVPDEHRKIIGIFISLTDIICKKILKTWWNHLDQFCYRKGHDFFVYHKK